MGKWANSELHALYSDWHYQLTEVHPEFKKLWCTDLDRLWVEVDQDSKGIVAVCDLKWLNGGDDVTVAEQIVYDWFKQQGVRVLIIRVARDFKEFQVQSYPEPKRYRYTPDGYAKFLYYLREKVRKEKLNVQAQV